MGAVHGGGLAGMFEALIGSSAADIWARLPFRLTETAVFGGPDGA